MTFIDGEDTQAPAAPAEGGDMPAQDAPTEGAEQTEGGEQAAA